MTALARYLRDAGISQADLARRLKISKSFMNQLVGGSRRPSGPLAEKMEKLTGIPFKTLVLGRSRGTAKKQSAAETPAAECSQHQDPDSDILERQLCNS
jgi:ribosome-binding protein aMBF1 (putative translation factor)